MMPRPGSELGGHLFFNNHAREGVGCSMRPTVHDKCLLEVLRQFETLTGSEDHRERLPVLAAILTAT